MRRPPFVVCASLAIVLGNAGTSSAQWRSSPSSQQRHEERRQQRIQQRGQTPGQPPPQASGWPAPAAEPSGCNDSLECLVTCYGNARCRKNRETELRLRFCQGRSPRDERQCVSQNTEQELRLVNQQRARDEEARLAAIQQKKDEAVAVAAREIAEAQPDPAIAKGKAAGVDMTFFDVPLGMPIRTFPECPPKKPYKEPCQIPPDSDSAFWGMMFGIDPPPGGRFVGGRTSLIPKWAVASYGTVTKGVLVAFVVATERAQRAATIKYLRKKYGKPTSETGEDVEWVLPGLHVRYQQPTFSASDMNMAVAAPNANCSPSCNPALDKYCVQCGVSLGSSAMAYLGNRAQMQQATRPNLFIEIE